LLLPGQLTDGIEESDDPVIDIRDGAYALSFSRVVRRSDMSEIGWTAEVGSGLNMTRMPIGRRSPPKVTV
jgi:hypothetical protein